MVDVLCRGLLAAGHQVLLCASADSTCPVEVFRSCGDAKGTQSMHSAVELAHVIEAYQAAVRWQPDVVHDHTVIGPLLAERFPHLPVVTTNHGPFDGDLKRLYLWLSAQIAIVTISHDQASHAQDIEVARVIHHGIDVDRFPAGDGRGGYVLFLGRMTPEKGVATAIRVARAAEMPLRIAAKMREPAERRYFAETVEPLLGGDVDYVGEVTHEDKLGLLGDAVCLLNPIEWSEPFGLVMIEALACGTPVVATPVGSVPEIVDDGVTGYLARRPEGLVRGITQAHGLSRSVCRAHVERSFSAERMVADHLRLYRDVLQRRMAAAGGGRG
jgi:glycosyltransferase involved in cell wall biosynthesis